MERPNSFPVRRVGEGPWEVFITEQPQPRWVACADESEARLIATAPQARFDALTGARSGEAFAAELEALAGALIRCRMSTAARFFRQQARVARENGAAAGT